MNCFQMAVLGHAATTFFSENKKNKKILFSYIRFYNVSSRPCRYEFFQMAVLGHVAMTFLENKKKMK